jgi:hypothetical protein
MPSRCMTLVLARGLSVRSRFANRTAPLLSEAGPFLGFDKLNQRGLDKLNQRRQPRRRSMPGSNSGSALTVAATRWPKYSISTASPSETAAGSQA